MTQVGSSAFLGAPQAVETAFADTVLLHVPYAAAHFHHGLFAAHGVAFPDKLSKAVNKRQADYLAGRALVNRAFAALELPPQTVNSGPDRAPIWPEGVTGSISHTSTSCACILSRNTDLRIGIDIETDLSARGDKAVRKIALRDDERRLIDAQANTLHLPALIFSAKETLFKALYPIVQDFFGFDCAQIKTLPGDQHIRLHLAQPLHPMLPAGAAFDIRYQRLGDQFLTWLICEV